MCEQCEKIKWYAGQLDNELRHQARFAKTPAEAQAKLYAAQHVLMVIEDWPNKYLLWEQDQLKGKT